MMGQALIDPHPEVPVMVVPESPPQKFTFQLSLAVLDEACR